LFERWACQVLVIQEQSTAIGETVAPKAAKECLYAQFVLSFIPAGIQYFKPEHVVAQGM
jgi:hypothetical protein